MTTPADRIEMALMGRFGKGPASRTMLLSTLVDAAIPFDDTQPALEAWMQSALRRQVIEQCPGDSYCYRLHTKTNIARRPTKAEPDLMDVDEPDDVGDESKPPTTAAEWRARAMSKQRIRG